MARAIPSLMQYAVDNENNTSGAVSFPSSSSKDSRMAREISLRKRKVPALRVKQSTLKEESNVTADWCAYLLISADSHKTYVGVTYDPFEEGGENTMGKLQEAPRPPVLAGLGASCVEFVDLLLAVKLANSNGGGKQHQQR